MKACVFTLGCKVNEAESASLMAGLEARGYTVTDELSPADVYILNTCAVTAEAEKKSRQAIARIRKCNPEAKIIVCGCASQRDPQAFAARDVAVVTGAMHKDRVLELLDFSGTSLENEDVFCELPIPKRTHTRANLRIQDGCNRFCSYCIIPYLRGRTRSRSLTSILAEASACTAQELVLTGIDITSYRDGDKDLGDVLLALSDFPFRVRLGSLEEGVVTRDFLEKMRAAGNVCEHFHLSLQSGSDAVLKKMNRRYTRAQYLEACALIYEFGGGLFRHARHRGRGGVCARARLSLFPPRGDGCRKAARPSRGSQKGAHGATFQGRRGGGGTLSCPLSRQDAGGGVRRGRRLHAQLYPRPGGRRKGGRALPRPTGTTGTGRRARRHHKGDIRYEKLHFL